MLRRFEQFFPPRRLREHQPTTPESRATSPSSEKSSTTIKQRYYDSAQELRSSLQQTCSWLDQKDLRVAGERPVDSGRYADVWGGSLDGRDVAVKSYRLYTHPDFRLDFVRLVGCKQRCASPGCN